MPVSPEYRCHQPSQGPVEGQAPRTQPQGVGRPDIPAADAEAHLQPAPDGPQQKDRIRQRGPPGPQGP